MKQYLPLLCTIHTDIFILFILFYILISWSIPFNPFHNILVTDHHSTIFKNTTMYKTCICTLQWDSRETLKISAGLPVKIKCLPVWSFIHSASLHLTEKGEREIYVPKWVTQQVAPIQGYLSQNLVMGRAGKERTNSLEFWMKYAITEFLATYPEIKKF